MFKTILLVCTGNICRSPTAEALLQAQLADADITVTSAGTAAVVGAPADATASTVAKAAGLDLSRHRGRQLTLPMLSAQDLVLVMEQEHGDWIHGRYPQLRGRVQLLGRWREQEIEDPYHRPLSVYQSVLAQMQDCVADWVPRLR